MHSPPRKVTVQDMQNWKVPPCISNWKNIKGYTIPLDKRLAADGRGLQEVQINDKFAKLSESLFLAERVARKEIETRAQMQKTLHRKQKEVEELNLREMAAQARKAGQRTLPRPARCSRCSLSHCPLVSAGAAPHRGFLFVACVRCCALCLSCVCAQAWRSRSARLRTLTRPARVSASVSPPARPTWTRPASATSCDATAAARSSESSAWSTSATNSARRRAWRRETRSETSAKRSHSDSRSHRGSCPSAPPVLLFP